MRVYFYLGGEPGSEGLVPVERTVAGVDPVAGALAALLAGPTGAESGDRRAVGDSRAGAGCSGCPWPAAWRPSTSHASTSRAVAACRCPSALGQVVYTLTQFPEIAAVAFRVEGRPVTVFSGEGIVLDHAQTRADSEGVLPAIFVDQPTYGSTLENPARIAGTADVFEAQFRVTLLDGDGATIADVPARASCGTGAARAGDRDEREPGEAGTPRASGTADVDGCHGRSPAGHSGERAGVIRSRGGSVPSALDTSGGDGPVSPQHAEAFRACITGTSAAAGSSGRSARTEEAAPGSPRRRSRATYARAMAGSLWRRSRHAVAVGPGRSRAVSSPGQVRPRPVRGPCYHPQALYNGHPRSGRGAAW